MSANILNLLLGVIATFLLPKYLLVEEYALLKSYQLYISYCGLFHFGYVDAVYLEYGGENLSYLTKDRLIESLSNMRIFQIAIVGVILLCALISRNYLLILFGLTILPMNMISYFQYMFQAMGEFGKYSDSVKKISVLNFLGNLVLLLLDVENAYFYIYMQIAVKIFIMIALENKLFKFYREYAGKIRFSLRKITNNIQIGFPLLLGNLMSEILTSIDRWFVKFLLGIVEFAQYSFAVNIEGFVNALVSPITITLYSYFCNNYETEKIIRIRKILWILSAYLISGAFLVKWIIKVSLKKYYDACTVIFLLCAAQFVYIIIKGIYVNLYKVNKRQKEYFKKLLIIVIESIALNVLFTLINKTMYSLALATLAAAISWLLVSNNDFKEIGLSTREFIYMFLILSVYLLCSFCESALLGGVFYVFIVTGSTYIIFRNEIKNELKKIIFPTP